MRITGISKSHFRTAVCMILPLAAFGLPGCGAKQAPYPAATLSGQVSLDGEPVEQGNISFMPAPGQKGQPAAADIVDGHYNAQWVPLGKVRVRIIINKETGRMITGSSEPVPEIKNVAPIDYQRGVPLEVTGDNDQQDFEMKSS